jgi:hypothetical protein
VCIGKMKPEAKTHRVQIQMGAGGAQQIEGSPSTGKET